MTAPTIDRTANGSATSSADQLGVVHRAPIADPQAEPVREPVVEPAQRRVPRSLTAEQRVTRAHHRHPEATHERIAEIAGVSVSTVKRYRPERTETGSPSGPDAAETPTVEQVTDEPDRESAADPKPEPDQPATTATEPDPGQPLAQLKRIRWAVRGVLALGVAASIAGNVLHARDELISQIISAWSPLALLLTIELISRVPVHRRHLAIGRWAATALIAGIAAWVSYWHMAAVASRYGETNGAQYLLPLSVDGLVVVASICLVELGGRIRSHRTT